MEEPVSHYISLSGNENKELHRIIRVYIIVNLVQRDKKEVA